ncbi:MAG: NADH-quinone oxidoreductase subunit C, partial [Acidobacteriaceae bacterium]
MYDPASALTGKAAVFEAMAEDPAVVALAELATDAKFDRNELTITVARESIVAACEAVKAAGFNFFEDLTAVDWYPQEPRFQLSYHIVSHSLRRRVRLRVLVDSSDASVPSITAAWPSANFFEREVFDLFGIDFPGHP